MALLDILDATGDVGYLELPAQSTGKPNQMLANSRDSTDVVIDIPKIIDTGSGITNPSYAF